MRFVRENQGFTGAEKALLITFGLVIAMLIGYLVQSGAGKAGTDARTVLAAGSGQPSSQTLGVRFDQSPRAIAAAGQVGAAGAIPTALALAAPAGGNGGGGTGAPRNPSPDWDRYNLEHKAVQVYFTTVIRPGARMEVGIPGAGPNGGTGFADIVDGNQVWEVKPARPWYMDGTGQAQLNRYLTNRPGSVPGVMYNEPFTVPYPGDPTRGTGGAVLQPAGHALLLCAERAAAGADAGAGHRAGHAAGGQPGAQRGHHRRRGHRRRGPSVVGGQGAVAALRAGRSVVRRRTVI